MITIEQKELETSSKFFLVVALALLSFPQDILAKADGSVVLFFLVFSLLFNSLALIVYNAQYFQSFWGRGKSVEDKVAENNKVFMVLSLLAQAFFLLAILFFAGSALYKIIVLGV